MIRQRAPYGSAATTTSAAQAAGEDPVELKAVPLGAGALHRAVAGLARHRALLPGGVGAGGAGEERLVRNHFAKRPLLRPRLVRLKAEGAQFDPQGDERRVGSRISVVADSRSRARRSPSLRCTSKAKASQRSGAPDPCSPLIISSGRTLMPGASMSTKKAVDAPVARLGGPGV